MDDVTIGGDISVVAKDVEMVSAMGAMVGLELNHDKCELVYSSSLLDKVQEPSYLGCPVLVRHLTSSSSCSILDDDLIIWRFPLVDPREVHLLGAPLSTGPGMDRILEKRCFDLERMIGHLELLASQDALLILRTAFGSSRLMNVLRSSPCAEHHLLVKFDDLLRSGVSKVTNCAIDDIAWIQASLPINDGGLGIRSVVVLAPSAFLASAAATYVLQSAILGGVWPFPDQHVAHVTQLWCSNYMATPPEGDSVLKQRNWDRPAIERGKSVLASVVDTPSHRARLLAVSAPHAGDWLKALPISSCGLRLEDDAVRVGVGIRLGLNICEPHLCVCGSMVDQLGLHALSCKFGIGRLSRHGIINDIVCRAFTSAGIPAIKEPTGLIKGGALRPDGMTLTPWSEGRSLTWDVTVVHTLAQTNLAHSVHAAGSAAEAAAARKVNKYVSLTSTHLFVPIALETLGPVCGSALDLLSTLGSRLTERSGDPRERSFLFQRISIAIQRGNSVALHGTFGELDPT